MLKIISSNIRFHNPKDGKNDWHGRKGFLSEVLNDFSPCILGTQEGWRPQLNELNELLNEELSLIDSHRDWIEERMYPCLFYNCEKMELLDSGDIWLSKTPYVSASKDFDSAFPRLCTWANLKFKKNSNEVFCVNVHLDHVKTETRQEQIRVLINEVQVQNTKNLPIILMGDFNEGPFAEVRKILENSDLNLRDPWIQLNKEEEESHHSFHGTKDNAQRIDWILVSECFKPESIDLFKKEKEGVYPSDHYPVLAKFKYDC
jgi:endonuclease/exonuclease/phosphatase family metal-dependent hydrolase